MHGFLACTLAAFACGALSAPAAAEVVTLISAPSNAPASDRSVEVELLFANHSTAPVRVATPERVRAELRVLGRALSTTLDRIETAAEPAEIAAGAFRRVRYRLALPPGLAAGTLAILRAPALRSNSAALVVPPHAPVVAGPGIAPAAREPRRVAALSRPDGAAAYLQGLSAYAPVYAVVGAGTNSNVKLQLGFKYRLFGAQGVFGGAPSPLDGLHFAYTQRMFWDTGRSSAPFRNIDFHPELVYILPHVRHARDHHSLQLGLSHESNGREGAASRSVNTAYIQPSLALPLGTFDLVLGPRAWIYYGKQRGNKDVERYRGYTGIAVKVGEDDGVHLNAFARMNFASGKGAAQADLSYPLDRLVWDRLNLFLYGQIFTGYGENLLDYDRNITRLRMGIAVVR